jgi:hypothetical protein
MVASLVSVQTRGTIFAIKIYNKRYIPHKYGNYTYTLFFSFITILTYLDNLKKIKICIFKCLLNLRRIIILMSSVHIDPYFSMLDITCVKYVYTLSSNYLSFNGQTYECLGNSTCWPTSVFLKVTVSTETCCRFRNWYLKLVCLSSRFYSLKFIV